MKKNCVCCGTPIPQDVLDEWTPVPNYKLEQWKDLPAEVATLENDLYMAEQHLEEKTEEVEDFAVKVATLVSFYEKKGKCLRNEIKLLKEKLATIQKLCDGHGLDEWDA
jgi:hypothetical protein